MKAKLIINIIPVILIWSTISQAQNSIYPWLNTIDGATSPVCESIDSPPGFARVAVEADSYADWLRNLPIKLKNNEVYLFNGKLKSNQNAQFKVLAVDVGNYNLQQCADAVIRLRAEYLFSLHKYNEIAFNFTSGDRACFSAWINGFRPIVNGNTVCWEKHATQDSSYSNFRAYLNAVFTYAGSYSLSREMKKIDDVSQVKIGDVFIQGGFPGHAVLVVDMAVNKQKSSKAILLAQSYMPAQEIHILVNPRNSETNPWYVVKETDLLYTPQWTFNRSDLKRFR